MILILSKTLDGDNVINKTITDSITINIKLKNTVDIINPELLLLNIDGVNYFDFNYCEIPALKRKYFIKTTSVINNKMTSISCECDYLDTFKTEILASIATYKKPLAVGDYGDLTLSKTGKILETQYESDLELTKSTNYIFSVMGGL